MAAGTAGIPRAAGVANRKRRLLSGAGPDRRDHRLARVVGGIQQIVSPVRRDFYVWLAFSGCRAGETMSMAVKNTDLKKGVVRYPITKTSAFEMPLSNYMIELLRNRIEQNAKECGAGCQWVFPSVKSASGHLEEEKLIATEPK